MKKITVFVMILTFVFLASCSSTHSESMTIDVLSIGKADCIIIRQGEKTVMIDTGEEENAPEILAYLQMQNITVIDTLILTHFDKDHIGGAATVCNEIDVKQILESDFVSDRFEYTAYHKVISEQNKSITKLSDPVQFTIGTMNFIVDPPKNDSYSKKEDNNASLIVSLSHENNRFLFCADAMELRLQEWLSDGQASFDFIKLPYHANYLDNYEFFLDQVSPKYAVACNSDKNPGDEKIVQLCEQRNIHLYQTRYGSVQIRSDGENITISQG